MLPFPLETSPFSSSSSASSSDDVSAVLGHPYRNVPHTYHPRRPSAAHFPHPTFPILHSRYLNHLRYYSLSQAQSPL